MSDTQVRAVVFDVDGTLLDTREFIIRAFEHSIAHHGHRVPTREEFYGTLRGQPLRDIYDTLVPDGDVDVLCDTHRTFQHGNQDLVAAYDGLFGCLEKLRARGLLLGICTSRGKTVQGSLERVGALRYFDAVVDALQVSNHKPHPEGVLKTLELLNIAPSEAVMVGDSAVDIGAGKSAGCAFTVGITHGFGPEESLRAAGADVIVHSLAELATVLVPH